MPLGSNRGKKKVGGGGKGGGDGEGKNGQVLIPIHSAKKDKGKKALDNTEKMQAKRRHDEVEEGQGSEARCGPVTLAEAPPALLVGRAVPGGACACRDLGRRISLSSVHCNPL